MQRRVSAEATVAGVNGDLFAADGRPSGALLLSGVLAHPPTATRSSIGITADGRLRVDRIRFFGNWRGTGQRRPLDLNESPVANGVSLFTPLWGPTTPAASGTVEAVLGSFPPAVPGTELAGQVVEVRRGGGTPIPPGGAVLVGNGNGAQRVLEEAAVGVTVTVRLLLTPDWPGVVDGLGGGPVLVRAGRPVFRHFEAFTAEHLARNPRTAVGQRADGRIVLVVVDGRQPGYSVGMTNFELAQTLIRLGAVSGSGLDVGGSSTMAFDAKLLNRPSDRGGERDVSNGLFVFYTGVYVAPPAEEILSPNGDGVGETQTLAYKVVRASRVEAKLLGPGGIVRTLDAADKAPGTYRFSWNGTGSTGTQEREGRWRFSVTARDDQGRTSSATRMFSLDRTLSSLTVAPALVEVPRGALRASFTLARPARVTARVETVGGVIVGVVARRSLGAGRQTIVWNGRLGGRRLPNTGRYVLRIQAASGVGRAELAAPFAVRRVGGTATRGR